MTFTVKGVAYQVAWPVYSAIVDDNYRLFHREFFHHLPPYPRGTPMSQHIAVAHMSCNNYRIRAELLRHGADLCISDADRTPLPERAVLSQDKPLIWLILYCCGMQPFYHSDALPQYSVVQKWQHRALCPRPGEYSLADGQEWLRQIEFNKQKIKLARRDCVLKNFDHAFDNFNKAASNILTYHHGNDDLVAFYQEEAFALYQQAVEALIADISNTPKYEDQLPKRFKLRDHVHLKIIPDLLEKPELRAKKIAPPNYPECMQNGVKLPGICWFSARIKPYEFPNAQMDNGIDINILCSQDESLRPYLMHHVATTNLPPTAAASARNTTPTPPPTSPTRTRPP